MRGNKYVIGKDMLKLVYAGHKLRVGMPAILSSRTREREKMGYCVGGQVFIE